jgi:hypothetical protein
MGTNNIPVTIGMEKLLWLLRDGARHPVSQLQTGYKTVKSTSFSSAMDDLLKFGFVLQNHGANNSPGTLRLSPNAPQPLMRQIDEANSYTMDINPATQKPWGEEGLYPAIRKSLEQQWAYSELQFDQDKPHWVEDMHTNKAGRHKNPDITLIGFQNLANRRPTLEVVIFEVKPKDEVTTGWESQAIGESSDNAPIPNTRVTQAYLMFHVPAYRSPDPMMPQIITAAKQAGIGVIEIADPKKPNTWKRHNPAATQKPDPSVRDVFIGSMPNGSQILSVLNDKKVPADGVANQQAAEPDKEPQAEPAKEASPTVPGPDNTTIKSLGRHLRQPEGIKEPDHPILSAIGHVLVDKFGE